MSYSMFGDITMAHIVGHKGQVVIAKEIRDRLGVEPGWLALQRLVGDHVELYFLPPEHRESLKGSLAKHIKRKVSPGDEWNGVRETAWHEAGAEKAKVGEPEP
jgi:bifunctional DNA-binding transcriptional regulator/antitoxin component of YhaV-PrlF toxin-antitoxin module